MTTTSHSSPLRPLADAPADRMLRQVLTVNIAISLVWGLAVTLGAGLLVDPLGVPIWASVLAGVIAIAAAATFWRFRSRDTLRAGEGMIAVAGDLAFGGVVALAAILAPEVTVLGRWLVGLSGLVVLDLGIVEYLGVRRIRRSAGE